MQKGGTEVEHAHLMIFVCIATPLSMMLFVFKGRAKAVLGFLLAGIFMCLFAGEINGLIQKVTDLPMSFLTVNVTPVTEEILKALPIVFMAFLLKPGRGSLLEYSIAAGVGFATLENACMLFDYSSSLSALNIIARGFGAGMMHGISTLAVGYSMLYVIAHKRMSYAGTVAALSIAIIYHSIYNIVVQSAYPVLGILLPTVTFVPLLITLKKRKML